MDWKSYRIFCEWCKKEIEVGTWSEVPDLNYYGKVWRTTGKYWHAKCAQEKLDMQNWKNRIFDDE